MNNIVINTQRPATRGENKCSTKKVRVAADRMSQSSAFPKAKQSTMSVSILSGFEGHSNLMKNSSLTVAMHQNKAFMLSEQAKEESKQIGAMSADVLKKEENLQKIKKKVCEVSNNFNELEFFKGRFLKHIYLH